MISTLFHVKGITLFLEDNKDVSTSLMTECTKSSKDFNKKHQFTAVNLIQTQIILLWVKTIFLFTILTISLKHIDFSLSLLIMVLSKFLSYFKGEYSLI